MGRRKILKVRSIPGYLESEAHHPTAQSTTNLYNLHFSRPGGPILSFSSIAGLSTKLELSASFNQHLST